MVPKRKNSQYFCLGFFYPLKRIIDSAMKTLGTIDGNKLCLETPKEGVALIRQKLKNGKEERFSLSSEESYHFQHLSGPRLSSFAKLWVAQRNEEKKPKIELLVAAATFKLLWELRFVEELGYSQPALQHFSPLKTTITSGANKLKGKLQVEVSYIKNNSHLSLAVSLQDKTGGTEGMIAYKISSLKGAENLSKRCSHDIRSLMTNVWSEVS